MNGTLKKVIFSVVITAIAMIGSMAFSAESILAQTGLDIGYEEWRDGPAYGASANWNECRNATAVWQLDPGWVLIEYDLGLRSDFGRSNINTSFLQAEGYYRATREDVGMFDIAIDAAVEKGMADYAGQLRERKSQYLRTLSEAYSSHTAIQVNVSACGSDDFLDRRGGSITGQLRLHLRYVGTPEIIESEVEFALAEIEEGGDDFPGAPPPEAPRLVVEGFGYGDSAGGWRVDRHPRVMADVDGDGDDDIVGFANSGVYVSLAAGDGGFGLPSLEVRNFGAGGSAGGWQVGRHPRVMADVDGDGDDDIVGFANSGVYVSLAAGDGSFGFPQLVVEGFGYSDGAGGWQVDRHPRMMADVDGDGDDDIVGFANSGVYVSLAAGDGGFGLPSLEVRNFGAGGSAGGWQVGRHPRVMADVNGDGRADIVGFAESGVYVSLAVGDGSFTLPRLEVRNFGAGAGGWQVDRHPRMMADVDGDGDDDIVGFAESGVYVSLAAGDGSFTLPRLEVRNFGAGGSAGSWSVDRHPRMMADVDGDGNDDIVGFSSSGVYVSLAAGDGSFGLPQLVVEDFGYDDSAGQWRVDRHPRMMADVDGDGDDDIVGFSSSGVMISFSN